MLPHLHGVVLGEELWLRRCNTTSPAPWSRHSLQRFFYSWEPMIFLGLILQSWVLPSRSLLPFCTTRTTLSLFVSAKPFWGPILYSTCVFACLTNMLKRSSTPSLMSFSGDIEAFGIHPRDFSRVMVSTSIGRGRFKVITHSFNCRPLGRTMLSDANSSHFLLIYVQCTFYTKPCLVASWFSYFCGFHLPHTFSLLFPLAYHLATCVHSTFVPVLYGMHSTLVCLCFIRYAQYISVHSFYMINTVDRCVFVLYRLCLLFFACSLPHECTIHFDRLFP